jgi:2-C-methyl-D-erythritol 2,4-cyclodiphosphate synthase
VAEGDIAVIHDAARCMVGAYLVQECIADAERQGSGVAAMPMTDTVLQQEGTGLAPLARETLWRMQTPQAFGLHTIRAAYAQAALSAAGTFTDDASVWIAAGHIPFLVHGSEGNRKLTSREDWEWAEAALRSDDTCTVYGTGFDTHRLVGGRKLILGGVDIPFEKGLLGHSDADVLLHAVCDAILGACALGDIGRHFPDTDAQYKGADSRVLLRSVADMVQKRDRRLTHIDATILCQRPKLSPYIPKMRENIAADLGLPLNCVSVKATTTEEMNDEGRGLCISAQAIASVVK